MVEVPASAVAIPASFTESQIAVLFDLMQRINQVDDLEPALAQVADTLRAIFDIDRFAVVLLESDGTLRVTVTRGLSSTYLERVRQHIQQGAAARAMAQRRPLWVPDATQEEQFGPLHEAAREEGFRSVLIWPLLMGADPLGYLIMYHDRPRTYTAEEIALAQALVQQAAVAVHMSRLLQATERRRAELEDAFQRRVDEAAAIDDIVLSISSSLDIDQTWQAITQAAAKLSGSTYASLWILDAGNQYRPVASTGIDVNVLRALELPAGNMFDQVRQSRSPVMREDYVQEAPESNPEHSRVVALTSVRAVLAVPLMEGDAVVGALYVGSKDSGTFAPDTVRVLQRLASFAPVALRNARRFTQLEAEHSRLQSYIDAIPEGVLVFDSQGHIVLTNQAVQREWELPAAEEGSLPFPQRYREASLLYRDDPRAALDHVLSTGETDQLLFETDDRESIFELNLRPLQADRGGVVATIRDVSMPVELGWERSQAHFLAELLELSAMMNSDLSIAVLIERVVEAAMALLGARSGTLGLIEGDRLVFRRFHRPEGWVDFDVELQPGEGVPGWVWKNGQPYISNDCLSDHQVISHRQQELGFRQLIVVPVWNRAGAMIGTLNVYDPVVPRDFREGDVEALQLLANQAAIALENGRLGQLKDEFLSVVSHELKTPVTSIKGFVQLLQRRLRSDSDESTLRYLTIVNHQADRLAGLINDLLDLSRIQTGRFSFSRQPLEYSELLHTMVDELQLVYRENPIALHTPSPLWVQGNAERLRQVLVNLIDNGVKYGPPRGDIRITVEQQGSEVVTYVCDKGEGLPPDEAERIFHPYYQIERHRLRQPAGLGLGLWITRQIVEQHEGRIWVDANDHTSFCFTVPVAER